MIADSRKAFDAEGQLIDARSARLVAELMGLLRAEAELLTRA
jgi:hypothetical protein